MINKKTLDAVKVGILTNNQLDEAINHYKALEEHLKCHGEPYHLVWKDVYYELMRLEDYKKSRETNKG